MALKDNFYSEIFTKEQKWIELINEKLLNSIYCNLVLKPFYEEKKQVLEQEYKLTGNKIIGQIIIIIDNIINQINLFNEQYNKSQSINLEFILPLFLINQMNNTNYMVGIIFNNNISDLKKYNNNNLLNQQYDYDDFPEELNKTK